MTHKISEIKGLDPKVAAKLQQAHVDTVDDLVKGTQTSHQRAELAKQLGVPPSQLTGWVNRANLMRLKGVGTEMANLLEDCGVDSVKELQHRKADMLATKLKETNDAKHITSHVPSHTQVQEWIEEARTLAAQAPT
jgi:predicted flap endonuclease-1-like 5' DNA nuclease